MKQIPVIDLFAGPGGLGEGFSSLQTESGYNPFKISLSIEKDEKAFETLQIRSFYRQFPKDSVPDEYYSFLKGEISRTILFNSFPSEAKKTQDETYKAELGLEPEENIDQRISKTLGNSKKWVLIGGPPCQAYSVIGRSRTGGIDPSDPRVYLYREYYRILAKHNPTIFIMENVKGLLSAKIKQSNVFSQILDDLSDPVSAYVKLSGSNNHSSCPGYRIYSLVQQPKCYDIFGNPEYSNKDYIIKAEDYGIPQKRHRVILLGIRKDYKIKPEVLKKSKSIPLKKVLIGLSRLRSGLSKIEDKDENWLKNLKEIIKNGCLNETELNIENEIKSVLNNLNIPRKKRGKNILILKQKLNTDLTGLLIRN